MLRSVNADSDELFMFEMEIDFPRVFDVELRSHPDPSLTPWHTWPPTRGPGLTWPRALTDLWDLSPVSVLQSSYFTPSENPMNIFEC